MGEKQPILIKRIAYPEEYISHNNKTPKRNQEDAPASGDPNFEGHFKFVNREKRLFASSARFFVRLFPVTSGFAHLAQENTDMST